MKKKLYHFSSIPYKIYPYILLIVYICVSSNGCTISVSTSTINTVLNINVYFAITIIGTKKAIKSQRSHHP